MFLDTTVFIDFLKGKQKIKKFLEEEKKLSTSVIVVMEVLAGFSGKRQAKEFEKFLEESLITVYHIDEKISYLALELFKNYFYSHSLGIADSLIAATAMVYRQKLATANLRHFKAVEKLKLQRL